MNADRPAAQRIARLTPLADVLVLLDRLSPVTAQDVPVAAEALGHVLAADAIVPQAIPPVALAARDGWAVEADTTRDAGPYAPMMLPPSTQRIDAFAPMPAGTDAVAPIDAVTVMGGMMQIMAPVGPGESVLPQGGDAASNAVLRKSGTPLRAIDIGQHWRRLVWRKSEFASHAFMSSLQGPTMRFCSRSAIFWPAPQRRPGAEVALAGDLDAALRDHDRHAVIGIGGTGSGRNDHAVTTLPRAGTLACHGIGLSPGETAAFGQVDSRPVLLIPGRIDAALACWLALAHPMIARLGGANAVTFTTSAELSRKITSTIGLADVVPVRRDGDTITPLASGMLPLQALAQADGWILVPAESEGYPAQARLFR